MNYSIIIYIIGMILRLGAIRTSSLTGKSSGIYIATYTTRHFTSPIKDIHLEK